MSVSGETVMRLLDVSILGDFRLRLRQLLLRLLPLYFTYLAPAL